MPYLCTLINNKDMFFPEKYFSNTVCQRSRSTDQSTLATLVYVNKDRVTISVYVRCIVINVKSYKLIQLIENGDQAVSLF